MSETFTKQELASQVLAVMEDSNEQDYNDFDELFNACFNTDEYIIGTYKAAQALNDFKPNDELDPVDTSSLTNGAFGAIGLIQQYEEDNFAEVNTDLSNPEKVASMVAYIRGESLFDEVLDDLGLEEDSDPKEIADNGKSNWDNVVAAFEDIVKE